jgi:hypothetical protein
MSPEDTKAALRNLINLTIKGDPDNQASAVVHDVLQAKMQARISPQQEAEAEETPDELSDE